MRLTSLDTLYSDEFHALLSCVFQVKCSSYIYPCIENDKTFLACYYQLYPCPHFPLGWNIYLNVIFIIGDFVGADNFNYFFCISLNFNFCDLPTEGIYNFFKLAYGSNMGLEMTIRAFVKNLNFIVFLPPLQPSWRHFCFLFAGGAEVFIDTEKTCLSKYRLYKLHDIQNAINYVFCIGKGSVVFLQMLGAIQSSVAPGWLETHKQVVVWWLTDTW